MGQVQFVNSELTRIDYLDGWRGLAIVFLLIGHFFTLSFIEMDVLGVDLFFVLSGLLMSKILYEKRVPLTTFYKRRISRILPAFFLFVILVYGFDFVFLDTVEAQNAPYTLLFLRTYLPSDLHMWDVTSPIGHLWSLNVEEHSYVLLATIAGIAFLRGREYGLIIFMACMAIAMHFVYVYLPDAPEHYEIRTETAASHLLMACGYYLVRERFVPYVKSWMPVVAFVAGLFCYTEWAPWYAAWLFSPFLLAFVINHLAQMPRGLINVLSWRPLTLFGIWSYSIYLWQQPYYHAWIEHHPQITWQNPVLLVLSVLTGVFSFYLLENPLRNWINARW